MGAGSVVVVVVDVTVGLTGECADRGWNGGRRKGDVALVAKVELNVVTVEATGLACFEGWHC